MQVARVLKLAIVSTGLLVLSTGIPNIKHASAHDEDASPSKVTISEKDGKRIFEANGMPDHKTGRFPNRGNPNSIESQDYRFEMRLAPKASSKPQQVQGYLYGIALNGVVFDPGTAEVWVPGETIVSRPGPGTRRGPDTDPDTAWNYDGMGKMNLGIDENHAHVQPTGAYHYHGLPTGLIERLRKEKGDATMILVGYAADGYPIYAESGYTKADDASSPIKKLKSSYKLKSGDRPKGEDGPGGKYDGTFVQDYEYVAKSGDLDECNGRTGVTPEFPKGTYYYVLTETFPFVPRLFHGEPDKSFARRPPGPGGPGGPGRFRGPGRPPGPPLGRFRGE